MSNKKYVFLTKEEMQKRREKSGDRAAGVLLALLLFFSPFIYMVFLDKTVESFLDYISPGLAQVTVPIASLLVFSIIYIRARIKNDDLKRILAKWGFIILLSLLIAFQGHRILVKYVIVHHGDPDSYVDISDGRSRVKDLKLSDSFNHQLKAHNVKSITTKLLNVDVEGDFFDRVHFNKNMDYSYGIDFYYETTVTFNNGKTQTFKLDNGFWYKGFFQLPSNDRVNIVVNSTIYTSKNGIIVTTDKALYKSLTDKKHDKLVKESNNTDKDWSKWYKLGKGHTDELLGAIIADIIDARLSAFYKEPLLEHGLISK